MNVLYDSEGYEYPMDDYALNYVPLEVEQAIAGPEKEGIDRNTKNWKGPMLAWHC